MKAMGEIIRRYPVRSTRGERPRRLRMRFDSGSPWTFVKLSAVAGFRALLPLPHAETFGALGNGQFAATHLAQLQIQILGIWCRKSAYVVAGDTLEPEYEILAGHDFMQRYHVRLDLAAESVRVTRSRLKSAQRVIKPTL